MQKEGKKKEVGMGGKKWSGKKLEVRRTIHTYIHFI